MSDNQTPSISQDSGPKYARRYRIIWQAVENLTKKSDKNLEEEQLTKEITRIDGEDKKPSDDNYKTHLCWAGLIDEIEESLWKLTEEGKKLKLNRLDNDLCFQIRNNLWKEMKKKRLAYCKVIIGSLRAQGDGISVKDVFEQVHRQLNLSDENLGITDGDSPLCGKSKFEYFIKRGWEGLYREGYLQQDGKSLLTLTSILTLTSKGKNLNLKGLDKEWASNIYRKKTNALNLALTYKAIWEAACKKQYVTHTELANAHGRETLGSGIGSHLDRFMKECFKKGMPILGVMVVADDAKESGELTPGALEGTIEGAIRAGYHRGHLSISIFDYRYEQKEVLKWVKTAPTEWDTKDAPDSPQPKPAEVAEHKPYFVKDIMEDGCFLGEEEIDKVLTRWRKGKNLILQGPPGTGKTWLAKRLGKALIGSEDPSRIRVVQFHPSTSYEDFVLGYRPTGEDGKLGLEEGVFLEMVGYAKKAEEEKGEDEEEKPFVLVIEEINRGKPAQIFGELLTLIENTKRNRASAMQLTYHDEEKRLGKDVYVPKNLYIIGTMNLADRSLAMVDMALRRRFAFYDLKPLFIGEEEKNNLSLRDSGARWKDWCTKLDGKTGVQRGLEGVIDEVESIMSRINKIIKEEPHLGEHFCLGHSYFTPGKNESFTPEKKGRSAKEWVQAAVESNLRPLLAGYAVSNPEELEGLLDQLEKAGENNSSDE